MDGIGLELWNKKLLLCRYKRQVEFKACAELAHTSRAYSTEPLPSVLFQAGAENMDLMILHWKETFQGSWQRQKPASPVQAADQAQNEILPILTTEQKQIEQEVQSLGNSRGLGWKPEDLIDGKGHLNSKVSQLRAGCLAQIADVKAARQEELEREKVGKETRRREFLQTRAILAAWVLASALAGVGLGAYLNAKRSTADREYVDERMNRLMEGQRRMQDQLSDLHRSNRKIAFWTEKTPEQINKEIGEANESLAAQIRDIKEDTDRKIARVESEYARSGRDGGAELEMRKQGLLRLQGKLIEAAEAKTQKKLDDLGSQKRNIMR